MGENSSSKRKKNVAKDCSGVPVNRIPWGAAPNLAETFKVQLLISLSSAVEGTRKSYRDWIKQVAQSESPKSL